MAAKKRMKKRVSKPRPKKAAKKTTRKKAAGAGGQVPPPIAGIAKSAVGQVVQRFLDWDGVRYMDVRAEDAAATKFSVVPKR